MKVSGRIVVLVAFVAAIALAVVVGSGGLSSSHPKGVRSPSCLSATLDESAKLPGLAVDVSPAPATDTANPHTQVSFLGVPASEIHALSVVGQRSGDHHGQLRGYSQDDGASFLPEKPFQPGELVSVSATIGTGRTAKPASFHFRVDTPYSTASVPEFPNPTAFPSEYETFRTLPQTQAPILTVTAPDRDPLAGDIFTSNGPGPGKYGPLIYTPQGRLVWFDQLPKGLSAEDVNVQSYEGSQDLTFWQGRVLSLGYGDGEDLVLNSHYQVVAKVHAGNGLQADLHEFQLAPHDVVYVTAFNPIRCDLSSVEKGPKNGVILDAAIQEIDMKTGLVRWEWHALDHVAASESEFSPRKNYPWDYFHINSIDPEPDGNIFISARNTWAGYQLEGGSGRIQWRLGGLKSSFKMGPGTKTAWQHDGRILPTGEVTFFDDGANPPEHSQSRAVRIELSMSTHEARLTSQITHSTAVLSASQGNVQTLPDGNALIGFGGEPQISEYSPSGALLFDAHLPYPMIFYRAYRHPWQGHPSTPPAIVAALNNTSEETIVHASWNGATEVASWPVLAGEAPGSLKRQITFPDSGFESSAILTKRYAYAAVQALDSSGKVLATSLATKTISYAESLAGGAQAR